MQLKNILLDEPSVRTDNGYVSLYWYDAGGNRTVKEHGGGEAVWVNSAPAGQRTDTVACTIYPSPYISVTGDRWTKHYYIGGERIASRTGTLSGGFQSLHNTNNKPAGNGIVNSVIYSRMCQAEEDSIDSLYIHFGVPYEARHTTVRDGGWHLYLPITHSVKAGDGEDASETAGTVQDRSHPHLDGDSQVYYYHRDHLGSTMSVTDSLGATVQLVEYTPWGEVFVELRGGSTFTTPYLFNGKELDEETGLYYYGARYYDPKLSVWYSVDNNKDLTPFITPYRAFFNNPTKFIDPSGNWEWDSDGNLIANKNDNSYSLAKFLGTSQNNALTILRNNNITPNKNGILNLKTGDKLKKETLWFQEREYKKPMVSSTKQAVLHYFYGNGEPVNIDDKTTWMLIMDDFFQSKHKTIISQNVKQKDNFSIDMTEKMFHIGNTNVSYRVNSNGKASSVSYTLFVNDGFWDPDFIDEKTLGKIPLIKSWTNSTPDGMGPNLERFGGKPYHYLTRKITFFFKPIR